MTEFSDATRVGRVIGAALFVATLLNGLGPFAKRVGLVQLDSFEQYWSHRCGPQGSQPMWGGVGRRCVETDEQSVLEGYRRGIPYARYLLAVEPEERPLKLAKDLVSFSIFVLGLGLAWHLGRPWAPNVRAAALWVLLGAVTIGEIVGASHGSSGSLLGGARSLAFLCIALAWVPTVSVAVLQGAARWCPALLGSQCVLVAWELLYPSGLPTAWLPTRAAGSLVHPNTLGVFAVVVLAFGLSFGTSRRLASLLWPLTVALVACSGSGSGWVVAGVLGLLALLPALPGSLVTRMGVAAAIVLLCIPALPIFTGRPDLLDSVLEGRLSAFRRLATSDSLSLVLGQGLGAGTNTLITQTQSGTPADSTVTLMTEQTGLLGVVLFYAALFMAWRRRREARPFLTAFALTSLTLNVTEVCPLGALLGLTLAFGLGSL